MYADSALDVARWFAAVNPTGLISVYVSDPRAKAKVRQLLEIGFSRMNEDLEGFCNPIDCYNSWE